MLKQTIQSPGSTLWILSKAESMMTCKKVKNGLERGRQLMSPVSLEFHTVVTSRIGHKIQLELEHPFHYVYVGRQLSSFHFLTKQGSNLTL